MSLNEIVGQNVRLLREIRGLSQHQFADNLGLTNTYVCRIEGGSLNISLKVVERLAKALEVPFKMLFEEYLLSLPLSAFERFPHEPEEKDKLRVEKERIKEQLRQDALRFRKALEAWGVEVKSETNSDN
ncbi:helix-turn-helix transcriptional regulator [bacterium]|nr:helix-turn-helix transcriptional regulator [bacterium]